MIRVRKFKAILRHTASIAVIGFSPVLASVHIAQAQERGGDKGEEVNEIETVVVTARKREEDVQKIPIAVTAFSGEQLKNQSVRTAADLQSQVPGLYIQDQSQDDPQSIVITMRGRKQDDANINVDNSVAYYVDGFYIPHTLGMQGSLIDLSRVEVLKGPQGTLYGRNTTGGAIGVFTNDPTDNLSGSIDVTGGNYKTWEGIGILNLPLADNLAARFVVEGGGNDGYSHTDDGVPLANSNRRYYRGKLRWNVSDSWKVVLSGHYEKDRAGNARSFVAALAPGADGICNYIGPADGSCATYELEAESVALRGGLLPNGLAATDANTIALEREWIAAQSPWYTLNPLHHPQTISDVGRWDVGLNISGDVTDDIQFRSITGYQFLNRKLDGAIQQAIFLFAENPVSTEKYFSQEFQILGTMPTLNWVFGLYGADQEGSDYQDITFVPYLGIGDLGSNLGQIHNTTLAIYAQATWEFVPDWHLTAGARYTSDKRHNAVTALDPSGACLVPAPGFDVIDPSNPASLQCPRQLKTSASKPTWLVSLDHQLTPDILVYAKLATGYRGGGINEGGSVDIATFAPFRPETNVEEEIGFKSEFLDHRVRLNVDGFHDKYSDLQVQTITTSPSGGFVTVETNAASATIWGMEAEGDAILGDGFSVHGTAAYTKAGYDSFPDFDISTGVPIPIDRSGEPFPVPKWTWSLSGQYTRPVDIGYLFFEVDYSWKSDTIPIPAASPANLDAVTQPAFGLLGARASFHLDAWNADIAVFGKNLMNKKYFDQGFDFEDGGVDIGYQGTPRLIGIEITKKFGEE